MNNADKPAYPIIDDGGAKNSYELGLTKRELGAFMIAQGLCARGQYTDFAQKSVVITDALLSELEKTKP